MNIDDVGVSDESLTKTNIYCDATVNDDTVKNNKNDNIYDVEVSRQ